MPVLTRPRPVLTLPVPQERRAALRLAADTRTAGLRRPGSGGRPAPGSGPSPARAAVAPAAPASRPRPASTAWTDGVGPASRAGPGLGICAGRRRRLRAPRHGLHRLCVS